MKKRVIISVFCSLIMLTACSDSDSSSSGLSVEQIENYDQKIEYVRGVRDSNEAAELAYNTLTDVVANLILKGEQDKIPTGALEYTRISRLGGDELQDSVRSVLEQNRIDSGSIRWNISKETFKPTYVVYKSDRPEYEGRYPNPMPYDLKDDEVRVILDSIEGKTYTKLKTESQSDSDDSSEAELTKTERLALLNKNAKTLYSIVEEVSEKYIADGLGDLIQDEYILLRSTNYAVGIQKEVVNAVKERVEDPRGDGILYIRFYSDTHKPYFVQWTCNIEPEMIGQYPDPCEDIDRENFTYGQKMEPESKAE